MLAWNPHPGVSPRESKSINIQTWGASVWLIRALGLGGVLFFDQATTPTEVVFGWSGVIILPKFK